MRLTGVTTAAVMAAVLAVPSVAPGRTPPMRVVANTGGTPASDFSRYVVTDDNGPARARITIYDSKLRRVSRVDVQNCAPAGVSAGTALLVCHPPATTVNLLLDLRTRSTRPIPGASAHDPQVYQEIGRQWVRTQQSDPACPPDNEDCAFLVSYRNWHTGAFRSFSVAEDDDDTVAAYDLDGRVLQSPGRRRYAYGGFVGAKLVFRRTSRSRKVVLTTCRVQCEQIHDAGGVVVWEQNDRRPVIHAYVVATGRRLSWVFPKTHGDASLFATQDEVIVSRPVARSPTGTTHRITAARWR